MFEFFITLEKTFRASIRLSIRIQMDTHSWRLFFQISPRKCYEIKDAEHKADGWYV